MIRSRTAVASAALESEADGVDITRQVLREVRTHWITTRSALDAVKVDVDVKDGGELDRIPVREFLSRSLALEECEPVESLHAAIAAYRVATAISDPRHSSSPPTPSRSARAPRRA
ncbi:hypothetical protein [Microbacterium sp. A1-JK]|uniref:hypothetical protein n=1 Tax=Microbacterium sp. A1-JK TaxID=3177516 RepID=UPI0038860BFE